MDKSDWILWFGLLLSASQWVIAATPVQPPFESLRPQTLAESCGFGIRGRVDGTLLERGETDATAYQVYEIESIAVRFEYRLNRLPQGVNEDSSHSVESFRDALMSSLSMVGDSEKRNLQSGFMFVDNAQCRLEIRFDVDREIKLMHQAVRIVNALT